MVKLTFTAREMSNLTGLASPCLLLPVFEGARLSGPVSEIDRVLDGTIKRTLSLGDFSPALGRTTSVMGSQRLPRVILVGAGERAKFNADASLQWAEAAAKALSTTKASTATVSVLQIPNKNNSLERTLERLSQCLMMALYRYTATLSGKQEAAPLSKINIALGDQIPTSRAKKALQTGKAIGNGANFTRELVNLPGNICTPTYLSSQARALGRRYASISTSVLGEQKMRELGMGSLLSVGHGSDQPSQLIVMEYKGGKSKDAPYALVGKGITFDTGGISLKPGAKMDEMKFDMGGAGSVFGAIQAIADMALPINVVGIVAAAENMPSGRATKPGDVVTSMSGKTIEILNTDAEGRLVLCDALTYASRFKPQEVVDIATLTGAIIVSLGNHASGIFANDDDLAEALLTAGQRSKDRGWRLPIWDDYQKQLESRFADIANIGMGGNAGSITAACFLARFAEEYRWAHIDIAGTAFSSAPKGATGRPVPMLVEYLRSRAGQ